MVITALATVNISLQAAVYSNVGFRCQNTIYIVVVAYGVGCGNIYISSNVNILSGSIPVTCINAGVFACVIRAGFDNQLVSLNIYLGAAIVKNLNCCAVGTCVFTVRVLPVASIFRSFAVLIALTAVISLVSVNL